MSIYDRSGRMGYIRSIRVDSPIKTNHSNRPQLTKVTPKKHPINIVLVGECMAGSVDPHFIFIHLKTGDPLSVSSQFPLVRNRLSSLCLLSRRKAHQILYSILHRFSWQSNKTKENNERSTTNRRCPESKPQHHS